MKIKTLILLIVMMLAGICVQAEEERYIIKFNDSVQFFNADGSESAKDFLSVTADELQEYIDAGVVERYEPDYVVELFDKQWNITNIKGEFPEKIGCLGTDVRVAVIDSGMMTEFTAHNALPGYNYVDKNTDTDDNTGHGTAVTAIVASSNCGVAYTAQFVPLKCFDAGHKTLLSELMSAIVDAVDVYDCDVINMSWGFAAQSGFLEIDTFIEKINYAAGKGAILVAAVGNDENATLNYPAGLENVIGVGAVGVDGAWAYFSNYNSSVHVVAPGYNLTILGVEEMDGTSYAAPHVSGLAAIAKCINKDITHKEFADLLAQTAKQTEPDETAGYDVYYGYGQIDCEAVVKKLIEGQKMHISPVEKSDTYTWSVIYNNTAQSETVFCICVNYDENGKMTGYTPVEATIDADRAYTFANPYSEGTVKYMVWTGLEGLVPLGEAKIKILK